MSRHAGTGGLVVHTPGPDPLGIPCESYEPDPAGRRQSDDFALSFECPVVFNGRFDVPKTAVTHVVLESAPTTIGVSAWSVSVALESEFVRITRATVAGETMDLLDTGFSHAEVADPPESGEAAAASSGAVTAVVLSLMTPSVIPVGSSTPIPRLESCADFETATNMQLPGDCDQDGKLNITDPICLLGHLFLGVPERLPCGEGKSREEANIRLLDWQGDGALDISDATSALNWLTLGGYPHSLGLNCVPIEGCPLLCFD